METKNFQPKNKKKREDATARVQMSVPVGSSIWPHGKGKT